MNNDLELRSLRDLSWRLAVPLESLHAIAPAADRFYEPFFSGDRWIDNPTGQLKMIQSRIQERLLASIPLPTSLHGGVRGRSPVTNAKTHVGKTTLVRIDVRQFYPHVTNSQVHAVWRKLGCGVKVCHKLTQLTTRSGHLPLGAPTSTVLANLALLPIDQIIAELADRHALSWTRYIDDIVLSGDQAELWIPVVVATLADHGFKVSHRKTSVMRGHHRQIVTGLVVNQRREPRVSKAWRLNLRAEIHQFPLLEQAERETAEQRIRGKLAYLRRTNPAHADQLQEYLLGVIARCRNST